MGLELGMVTIDCSDPRRLSAFWSAALGTSVAGDYGDLRTSRARPGGGTSLGFQRVPEGRTGKKRVHVDLSASDRVAEVRRPADPEASDDTWHSTGDETTGGDLLPDQ